MSQAIPDPTDFETVEAFLNWASDYFVENNLHYGHGTDNAWDEALALVLYVLKLPGENDRSLLQHPLNHAQQKLLLDLAKRRVSERKPVAYLTNEAWFAGQRFYVNEDVIIPRSPFAEIIGNHFRPWLTNQDPQRILDLCTGSGCLAIYCSQQFPDAIVDAVDISPQALNIAQKNIELHHRERRVNVIESDLFSGLLGQKYDIIISNPPYVGELEMAQLPPEYGHEPVIALHSGEDGLEIAKKIIKEAGKYLTPDGILMVEVGIGAPALEDAFPRLPFTWVDLEGGGEGIFVLQASELADLPQ